MRTYNTQKEFDAEVVNGVFSVNDDVEFNFNLVTTYNINARNIDAGNIEASNIEAHNINARNIDALDIKANDISYYAFCISYTSINCTRIKGRKGNSFHKCLDGELTIRPRTHKIKIDDKEIELSEESYNNFKKQFEN